MLTLSCAHCGSSSAHPLRLLRTKFTLFFVPLFVVHSEYQMQCTYCGIASRLSKQRAHELGGERVW